jgi:DNA-binding MarR family transcriptional regulator
MTINHDNDRYTAERRIVTGLSKVGLALRAMMWAKGRSSGLTPTQGQILSLLQTRGALRLSAIASDLGIRQPTATEAVNTLVRKGLVGKTADPDDGRAIALRLTKKGRSEAKRTAGWPDALMRAVGELDEGDQAAFLRALTKMIRALQINRDIAPARICVSCRFFRPHVHADQKAAHHCDFVNAPFGDRDLRLDCAEHEAAPDDQANDAWLRFTANVASATEATARRA